VGHPGWDKGEGGRVEEKRISKVCGIRKRKKREEWGWGDGELGSKVGRGNRRGLVEKG